MTTATATDISRLALPEAIQVLQSRLRTIEEKFSEMGYINKTMVQTEMKTKWTVPPQATAMFGMHCAICIETIDLFKQGRVRFFSPLFHDPGKTTIKN